MKFENKEGVIYVASICVHQIHQEEMFYFDESWKFSFLIKHKSKVTIDTGVCHSTESLILS